MRVVTWNVWWKFDDVVRRQSLIVENLNALAADVVLLQETWPDQVDELARTTGTTGYFLGDRQAEEQREFGVGLLLRQEPHQVREFALPAAPRQFEDSNRYFLAALIDGPTGPHWIGTTHLSHTPQAHRLAFTEPTASDLGRQSRLAQLDVLLPALAELQQSAPVVFGGDLNFMPGSVEYHRCVAAGWRDAWLDRSRLGARSTILADNPYLAKDRAEVVDLLAELPGAASGLDYCLDFQFCSPELAAQRAWTIGAGGTLDKADWPSDHLGVVVDYVQRQ